MFVDGYSRPDLLDVRVSDNNFALRGPSQTGVGAFDVDGARIVDDDFSGRAYAGVAGVTSTAGGIHGNDFCNLTIPPSAESALGFPPNEALEPIVFFDSEDARIDNNDCGQALARTTAGAGSRASARFR